MTWVDYLIVIFAVIIAYIIRWITGNANDNIEKCPHCGKLKGQRDGKSPGRSILLDGLGERP